MTLDHRKIELIREIAASQREELIVAVEAFVRQFTHAPFRLDLSKHANIRPSVDLEQLKRERPLKPFDMAEFAQEADALEWEQSTDELLEQLD